MNLKQPILSYAIICFLFLQGAIITPRRISPATVASREEINIQTARVSPNNFEKENNATAPEVQRNTGKTPVRSFDLNLSASAPLATAIITRGPYLQKGNKKTVTIRWRTDIPTDSKVRYGTTFGNPADSVKKSAQTTEHEIRIPRLKADTKYFYSVGTKTVVLEETDKNYFNTSPGPKTTRKIRIVAFGDCGNNSTNEVNVKNAYLNYIGSNTTDLWLLLGDNAYNSGMDNEFQSNFFNIYKGDMLKNCMLFPTLGNHDYANNATRQDDHNISYLSNFTLPSKGECGGVASGKEEYYSFDYGDIHFICLDSYGEENNKRFYDTTSTQVLWLKSDLAANQRKWTIAYWHHPPYTMGSHTSDGESELVNVRTNLIRILERNGVDLILNGHSHDYERSYLLKDHFGLENTFSFATNAVSNSSARYDGSANSCPYISTSAKIKHGTVYVVAGSAGQLGGTQGSFPHAAMYYSNATNGGSLVVEIEGNRLDGKFVATDNSIKDQFTIMKDVNKVTNITITSGQSAKLAASWIGNYNWSTGAVTKSVTVKPAAIGNYTYWVNDNANPSAKCLSDTFKVKVSAAAAFAANKNKPGTAKTTDNFSFKIYPNPANGQFQLSIRTDAEQHFVYSVSDLSGKVISSKSVVSSTGTTKVSFNLPAGIYLVGVINDKGVRKTEKVVVP